jgi:TrmH family RNA methyltransferase
MRQPETITSPANPLLKQVRKAISRGGPTERGWCVAETLHLLEEALRSHCRVQAVIAGASIRDVVERTLSTHNDIRILVVPDKLLDASSQGVVTLVELPDASLPSCPNPLMLVIDRVQDPGNLGTILRSAEAFGVAGVFLVKGTVSPLNPKVIRASAGSIFRVPFVQGLDDDQVLAALRERNATPYAAVPSGANTLANSDLTRSCAIIIGSEGHGISPPLRSAAVDVSIPTSGVESLNAAVSAGILLYEARRQRSIS